MLKIEQRRVLGNTVQYEPFSQFSSQTGVRRSRPPAGCASTARLQSVRMFQSLIGGSKVILIIKRTCSASSENI
jgi:hypothetical protein